MYWWRKNLKAGLPSAATTTVTVTPAIAPSRMATVNVVVSWSERDKSKKGTAAKTGLTKTYSTTANICTEIPC